MFNSREILLSIIRNQLFPSEDCIEKLNLDKEELTELMKEAKSQAVYPLVFQYVKNELASLFSAQEYSRYEAIYYAYLASALKNRQSHYDLHNSLINHHIAYVILKGQASAMYYPDPVMRAAGDVDFLVNDKDIDPVDSMLKERGYTRTEDSQIHKFHWEYKNGDASIELHWDIPGIPEKDNECIHNYLKEILDQAHLVSNHDGAFYSPSPFHHGLILLLHTVSHMTGGGIGLRHLCDWLVFENHYSDTEFRNIFELPLKDIGLWKLAKVLTRTGILYLGCEEREWCRDVDQQLCKEFLEDIFAGGNFGVKDSTRRSQEKLIQNRKTRKIKSGSVLENTLVNLDERTEQDHPRLYGNPLLKPVGYFMTGGKYALRVLTGKRNNVFKKDIYSDIQKRQRLYAGLKLFETDKNQVK